jgi:hypothetical protein
MLNTSQHSISQLKVAQLVGGGNLFSGMGSLRIRKPDTLDFLIDA